MDYVLQPGTLDFLKELKQNNNREWFAANKDRYLAAYDNVIAFTEKLRDEMSKVDQLAPETAKKSLWRIYRDVRFSKDKTPYKTAFSGRMKRASVSRRGGYYFRIQPDGGTAIVGGFWKPSGSDLTRVRSELGFDATPMRDILSDKAFQRNFGALEGDEVKTAPKGFTRDHPDIDLLRKKQFLLVRNFSDDNVLSPHFVRSAVSTYKAMRPFFDYMSVILTTDENGMPIV